MTNVWAYWQAEIRARKAVKDGGQGFVPTRDAPGTMSRDTNEPIDGYWRIMGAKTKEDEPLAIWRQPGHDHIVMQRGAQQPATMAEDSERFLKFRSTWFMSCAAVTKAEWDAALETGFWADGKPAKEMTENEKMGIDVAAGGNNPPLDESLADQIAALVAKAKVTPEPTTQAEADAATGILDKLRSLLKLAEAERVSEKEPHLEAGRAVDAKWSNIMQPGKDEGAALDARRKAYLRKEQQRLDDIAAEENRKRQEEARRAAVAERERLQREADERAAAEGAVADPVPEVEVAVETVEAERATAGTAYGRNSGLKKTKVAVIVDIRALAEHFIHSGDTDFTDYMQKRAQAALRGKVALPGVEAKDEYK